MSSTFCNCHPGETNSYSRDDFHNRFPEPERTCDDYPIENIDAETIPKWEQNYLPDDAYIMMSSVQKDSKCGIDAPYLYMLPLGALQTSGSFSPNTYSLQGHGASIATRDDIVIAGYVYNNTPNDIRLATNDGQTYNKAQFLILRADESIEGNFIVQHNGVYKFNSRHNYVVGYSYYLGKDGQPSTDGTYWGGVRQHLFDVIDGQTILINVYEEGQPYIVDSQE